MFLGAIEAGGTKFNCAIGTVDGEIIEEVKIFTADPAATLAEVIDWFTSREKLGYKIDCLGIGTFGPVDLHPDSPNWGYITNTPKPGWKMTDLAGFLGRTLGVKVYIDTDVNTAALWESRKGSASGFENIVYFTVGTGIGGGAVISGNLLHGLVHPEMGHVFLKRHPEDSFEGCCPFHKDCAEGLASGPAIERRWGLKGESIPPDHQAWNLEAWYVAQLVMNTQMMFSAQAIILGGGIFQVPGMLDKVRQHANELARGYLTQPSTLQDWKRIIRLPSVDKPGLQGALVLAADNLGC